MTIIEYIHSWQLPPWFTTRI